MFYTPVATTRGLLYEHAQNWNAELQKLSFERDWTKFTCNLELTSTICFSDSSTGVQKNTYCIRDDLCTFGTNLTVLCFYYFVHNFRESVILDVLKFFPPIEICNDPPPILAKCDHHHYYQNFHCHFHSIIHNSTIHHVLQIPCQMEHCLQFHPIFAYHRLVRSSTLLLPSGLLRFYRQVILLPPLYYMKI